MEYCTNADVENRLTAAGLRFVADRDRDGSVSSPELAAALDAAIAYAGQLIDAALCKQVQPADARSSGNFWLLDRAVDLAACRAAGHGGRDVPLTLVNARDFSLVELSLVAEGRRRVPGLVLTTPLWNSYRAVGPRVVNVE